MHEIEIRIPFRAGHRLMAPYQGKCNNLHGEGFTAIVVMSCETLDDCSMVIDFGVIKKQLREWIDDNWDHAMILNEKDAVIKDFLVEQGMKVYIIEGNPTSENLAGELYRVINTWYQGDIRVERVGMVESFVDSVAWCVR